MAWEEVEPAKNKKKTFFLSKELAYSRFTKKVG